MSIEQHAEAAAERIVERYDEPHFDFVYGIIAKHTQSAIDEATAPLRARIAALEGLGPLIEKMQSGLREYIATEDEALEEAAFDEYHNAATAITAILKGGAP